MALDPTKGAAAGRFSPIIFDYLKKYQEDPTSRVFAPLAEAYRKSGLIDEAVEIAREGLRVHPNFIGGRVALARALFDKGAYEEVVLELTPVIREVPDNLVAQKLIAESCLMLGQTTEALGAYKMLLYFSPQDPEVAKMVSELESQAYSQGALVLRTDPAPQKGNFQLAPTRGALDQDPQVNKVRAIRQIEFLQSVLQRVERYRARSRTD